jgi:hypothetical protein
VTRCLERPSIVSVFGLLVGTIAAAEPAPDKSRYSLFAPTPRAHMREMSTDRPDKTESPYTVDAGHFQTEMDLVTYARDRYTTDGTDSDSLSVAVANLKVGLTNWADAQLVIESYSWVRVEDRSGAVARHRGFGDLTFRLKANLWSNDEGATAFAVMPFVKLPTNEDALGNDAVEGGLILPLSAELPYGWGLGTMMEFDFNEDEDGDGHHPEFVDTVTLGHDIVGDLGGYVEFFSLASAERDSHWQATVDVGLTYALSEDVRLDGGVNVGVTRAAEDVNPFLGLSFRL